LKTALITGITGQDGAYLALLLLNKGYRVHGTYRRGALSHFWRLEELGIRYHHHLHLLEDNLSELDATIALLERLQPEEVYNLAAQSSVAASFAHPHSTAQMTSIGVINLLEAIRLVNRQIRFYQASSSEMFGKAQAVPQSEDTPFYPCSPYAVAKLNAHWTVVNYRETYDVFACSGILFNHESPLRGSEFVTRKITDSVARIKLNKLDTLELGNLNSTRDWGFAPEYVEGMWRILQADQPDTFVLASNRSESVRRFVLLAFKAAGISVEFTGIAEHETAVVVGLSPGQLGSPSSPRIGQTVVRVNARLFRPLDIHQSLGNPAKAKAKLGWEACTKLEQLCQVMVNADIGRNKKESL
jgi:GDPmannose 4,6-dehydratase